MIVEAAELPDWKHYNFSTNQFYSETRYTLKTLNQTAFWSLDHFNFYFIVITIKTILLSPIDSLILLNLLFKPFLAIF